MDHWNFSLTQSFLLHYDPGVDSPSKRNECQGYFPGVGGGGSGPGLRSKTLPPSCADCIDVLGASTSWNPKGLSRPAKG